ncbi:MAG: 20S proteasome A and B [Gallionellaceae bacterium]|nr:MAG: 20S proteasome A and B [Gallionellaceae bacterium]
MTTIVAVRKNGIVTIAADTLTTFGNTRLHASQDGSHDKILHIGESYIGVCGSAAHHLVLASLLAKAPEVQLSSKAAIFETFRKLHPTLKEECFLNPKEDEDDPYESSQITALIANASGIYGIYSMREVFEYTQFWAIGSGHEFSLGAMHHAYPLYDNAADIARAGVEAGIAYDKNSAAPVTLYSVALSN